MGTGVQGCGPVALPQDPATHGCPWQSASVVQVTAQLVPSALHLNGEQATAADALHVPRPSQVDEVADVYVVGLQAPPPQTSPLVYS
jgi:hypothetical protein